MDREERLSAAAADVREMRKRIRQAGWGHESMSGKKLDGPLQISIVSSLIRHTVDMETYHGLSGEDTMTILAYHALLSYETAMEKLVKLTMLSPTPTLYPLDPSSISEQTK